MPIHLLNFYKTPSRRRYDRMEADNSNYDLIMTYLTYCNMTYLTYCNMTYLTYCNMTYLTYCNMTYLTYCNMTYLNKLQHCYTPHYINSCGGI